MLRISVYGYAVRDDWRGQGDYALVDLTYFLDDNSGIRYEDILDMIKYSGMHFVPERYPKGHPLAGEVVRDKVIIEEMNIGVEPIEEPINPNEEMYTYG
jgi:hypothetical protein